MSLKGLEVVVIRNNFYRENYRNAAINFLLLVIAIILFLAFIYFMHINTVVARYFPTTPSGEYIVMPPLNINHLNLANYNFTPDGTMVENADINLKDLNTADPNNALVVYWAKKAVTALYDYDYVNYRQALQDVRDYFTLNGHAEFLVALNFSRNLEAVKNNSQVVSAEVVGEVTVQSGMYGDDVLAWRVVVPVKVIYQNITDQPIEQNVMADMLIVRETTLHVPFYGIAIEKINLKAV